jgi:hypothetical protein
MDEPIEELYFNWLYHKVASIKTLPTPSITYVTLMRQLHSTEFVWTLSGDDNRAEEGLDYRRRFLLESNLDQDPPWFNIPCSILELLIAFSGRASDQTELSARTWFWIFLTNLGLNDLSDSNLGIERLVNEIIDVFIWRTYDSTGYGGICPLETTTNDQTKLELWYQFCEYVVDKDIL